MTIDATRTHVWLGCIVLLSSLTCAFYSCAGQTSIRHGDSLDVSGYPQDIQDAYKVFAVRCSRCHTLARPLNARIHDAQHWVRYVQRMRLNQSSGINAKNGEVILHFLLYYMHQVDQENRERDESEPGESAVPPPADRPSAVPAAPVPSAPNGHTATDPPAAVPVHPVHPVDEDAEHPVPPSAAPAGNEVQP
jgi:hypothetical protein